MKPPSSLSLLTWKQSSDSLLPLSAFTAILSLWSISQLPLLVLSSVQCLGCRREQTAFFVQKFVPPATTAGGPRANFCLWSFVLWRELGMCVTLHPNAANGLWTNRYHGLVGPAAWDDTRVMRVGFCCVQECLSSSCGLTHLTCLVQLVQTNYGEFICSVWFIFWWLETWCGPTIRLKPPGSCPLPI